MLVNLSHMDSWGYIEILIPIGVQSTGDSIYDLAALRTQAEWPGK